MSLRPRYSLLSLLVVTALVAGGVKLWYGPHHVVERHENEEYSYAFNYDWRGNKNHYGPWFRRMTKADKLTFIEIGLWKKNLQIDWVFQSEIKSKAAEPEVDITLESASVCPMTQLEIQELQQAVNNEKQRIESEGYEFDLKYTGERAQTPFATFSPAQ